MSDDPTAWQPQTPPANMASTRTSTVGWRHNIPNSFHLCRKRAGSDGANDGVLPTASRSAGLRQAPTVPNTPSTDEFASRLNARNSNKDSHGHYSTDRSRFDGFRPRGSSLVERLPGSIFECIARDQAVKAATKRSRSHDDLDEPRDVPHGWRTEDIASKAVVEGSEQIPRSGANKVLVAGRAFDPTDPHCQVLDYAATTIKAKFLSVIPEHKNEKSSRSNSTSLSSSTPPPPFKAAIKLRTPADSPDGPNSLSPWDTNGPHERFIDGIEFEMLDAPTSQPQIPPWIPVALVSPLVESPTSIAPTTLLQTTPYPTSAESYATSMQPVDILVDVRSSSSSSPQFTTWSSSRASSLLLPETMMPGISRRLSEVSTGSQTTILINGSTISIPKSPPPPPPKTLGPSAALTPELENRASRRLTRSKSYTTLPPSCPKGSLPRPVSKFIVSLPDDFKKSMALAPPVPKVPSRTHTPSTSVSSVKSSSSASSVSFSPANKISTATSCSPSPPGSIWSVLRRVSRAGPPPARPPTPPPANLTPARPPPPPPLNLQGLGIMETPVFEVTQSTPVTRRPSRRPSQSEGTRPRVSHSQALKRQSSGSDKDGRRCTDVVKKHESGPKMETTVRPDNSQKIEAKPPLSRTKSQVRRHMVKKMALDNIGAPKVRDPSCSPRKPNRTKTKMGLPSDPAETINDATRPRLQSRNTMLRIQADEQQKVNSLTNELEDLEKQCSEAKRHQEALYVARTRLADDFPDDDRSITSVYIDDESSSDDGGPMNPGKEEALADIDSKIIKWRRELQQNEHKRNRIKKKLAWHSTDRLCVKPLPQRRTQSPRSHQVKTPTVTSPTTARFSSADYKIASVLDLRNAPALPTPKSITTEVPTKMPELDDDDARRPSVESSILPTPPGTPLTSSNQPWVGFEPYTPFLDTPARAASRVNALNVRQDPNRNTLHPCKDEEGLEEGDLRSPEPRADRQVTIQVFADSGITDLVASLQDEIDTLSRRVRI